MSRLKSSERKACVLAAIQATGTQSPTKIQRHIKEATGKTVTRRTIHTDLIDIRSGADSIISQADTQRQQYEELKILRAAFLASATGHYNRIGSKRPGMFESDNDIDNDAVICTWEHLMKKIKDPIDNEMFKHLYGNETAKTLIMLSKHLEEKRKAMQA